MKKFTLLFVALLFAAVSANAQTLNNPKDADGFYIVKWDCATNSFAASNNFEADETFTFAIDVTGTPFEDWLRGTPTEGATRSMAINKWSNYGEINGLTNRLKQIQGNIYGATWNILQMGASGTSFDVDKASGIDSVVFVGGQVFGFEYSATNSGVAWWQWPDGVSEGVAVDPGTGNIFKTLPNTAAVSSPEFYNDEYPGMFELDFGTVKGYTYACANIITGVENTIVNSATVVSSEFYNLQGAKLSAEPANGLFIKTSILTNGERVSEKVLKALK
ncbi:MAG: hypothetical protein LBV75_04305 [Paludibacter sp.]|jgi:hypothetical protein|nr:hypothetical protein [Paludibacter sp.]